MPDTTPNLALRFPVAADNNNTPLYMADLAQDVEDAILDTGTPAGTIRSTINVVADPGWELGNQTIVGCQTLYPALWAASPAGMKSGSDLVIPNLAELSMIGAGSFASLGQVAGANTETIAETNLPGHTHSGPSHTHTGPSHTHTGPSHRHTINHGHGDNISANQAGHSHWTDPANTNSGGHSTNHSHTLSIVTGVGASGTAYMLNGAQGHAVFGPYSQLTHGTSGVNADHVHATNVGNTQSTTVDPTITVSGGVTSHTGSSGYDGTAVTGPSGTAATGSSGTADTGSTGGNTDLNIVSKSFGVTFQIKAH